MPKQSSPLSYEPTLQQQTLMAVKSLILTGKLAPGSQLNEVALADQLSVSRGPLREALRQLAAENLIVTIPYRGSFVGTLTLRDVEEIFSMRTVLETFAFKLAWPLRTPAFHRELRMRHARLLNAIDNLDGAAAIEAELVLHDLVYEWSEHSILQWSWKSLRTKLQFYFAVHQQAHGRAGPARDGDDQYVRLALGEDLDAMLAEIYLHMQKGLETVRTYMRSVQVRQVVEDAV